MCLIYRKKFFAFPAFCCKLLNYIFSVYFPVVSQILNRRETCFPRIKLLTKEKAEKKKSAPDKNIFLKTTLLCLLAVAFVSIRENNLEEKECQTT